MNIVNTLSIEKLSTLPPMKSWQSRIKAHMKDVGVRQADVAKTLGMTQGGVGHWLTGRNEILLTDFLRLCRAAGANPQVILFGDQRAITPYRGEERRKGPKSDQRGPRTSH